MLSDEQMRKILPFSLLNDEQMSHWVGVKHLPVKKNMIRIPVNQTSIMGCHVGVWFTLLTCCKKKAFKGHVIIGILILEGKKNFKKNGC